MHPEFGYVGTSSFCRILVALLVCVLVAVASSVIRFKAAPQPDPKDAMALATGEAVSNTPSIPAAIADTYSDKGEFAQRPPNTGATAPTLTSRRPRFIQAINERPLIAAVPIGHTDRPAVLSSAPGNSAPCHTRDAGESVESDRRCACCRCFDCVSHRTSGARGLCRKKAAT
jgi:hypothetical protein